MFALMKSPVMYKKAKGTLINSLINPSVIYEAWKGEKPAELEDMGEVILNLNNKDLIHLLPQDLIEAIQNPKRNIIQKSLSDSNEIIIINMAGSQDRKGVCKVFYWGFRYTTVSQMGFWQFEWNSPLIRFSGRRGSFTSGNLALFSYEPKDFRILRLLTSEPAKPLMFQGVEIKPDEVVETSKESKEQEKREFYLPLSKRR